MNELKKMHWLVDTTATLPTSNAKIVIPDGYMGITAGDAQKYAELINGKSNSPETIEGAVIAKDFSNEVHFSYYSQGYIDESDWQTLDSNALFSSISQKTEEANVERRKAGLEEMHVVKWLHEPTYDKATHTAYWAIEGRDGNDDIVNSIAVRLNRNGFEKLTSISSLPNYQVVGGPLDVMLRALNFAPGSSYEDHISGDKEAGYGIAALVGAIAGAKAVQVAAAGGLAVFYKSVLAFLTVAAGKAWAIILVPFVWLKSRFKKKSNTTTPLLSNQTSESSQAVEQHDE